MAGRMFRDRAGKPGAGIEEELGPLIGVELAARGFQPRLEPDPVARLILGAVNKEVVRPIRRVSVFATVHESRAEKVHQAKEILDAHLKELAAQMQQGKSERLVRYLEFCAQFHAYSFGNLMLALAQCPQMTRIAGIRTWNKLGRHVRAGEKGIMILAPIEVTRRARGKQNIPLDFFAGAKQSNEVGNRRENPQAAKARKSRKK